MNSRKVQPFDAFKGLYKLLILTGFCKLHKKPKYKFLSYLYQIYRVLVFVHMLIIHVQHWIYIATIYEDDKVFECIMIEMPELGVFLKLIALNIGYYKLGKINETMNDEIFPANSEKDEKHLRKNRDVFNLLLKMAIFGISVTFILWVATPIIAWIYDPNTKVASYFPFDTNSTTRFAFTMLWEHSSILYAGYGNIAIDLLALCYYTQATVQLKIVRSHLEDMCRSDKEAGFVTVNNKRVYQYIDEKEPKVHERLIFCVKRYEKVIWFVNEVHSVFNSAISGLFFSTTFTICLLLYKMSKTPLITVGFAHLMVLLTVLLVQVFLYCLCGEILNSESKLVVDSVYQTEWSSLSPRFRRSMVIAMARWYNPIAPQVFKIVPMSLNTFVMIVRASFNLFTFLKNTTTAEE